MIKKKILRKKMFKKNIRKVFSILVFFSIRFNDNLIQKCQPVNHDTHAPGGSELEIFSVPKIGTKFQILYLRSNSDENLYVA